MSDLKVELVMIAVGTVITVGGIYFAAAFFQPTKLGAWIFVVVAIAATLGITRLITGRWPR